MTPTPITLRPLDLLLDAGAIRTVRWHGTEVVRHVSAPVRGTDWSTLAERVTAERSATDTRAWRHERETAVRQGEQRATVRLRVTAEIDADGARVDVAVDITARTAFDANRAGLCLLHPLEGVRGGTLAVRSPDGTARTVTLPGADGIAPAQSVRDIAAITHRIGSVDVHLDFAGETFEVEDQRNWTDASFKTYCRPLARARPFRLETGEIVHRSIAIVLRRAPGGTSTGMPIGNPDGTRDHAPDHVPPRDDVPAAPTGITSHARTTDPLELPALPLAVQPDWLDQPPVGCDGLVARFAADRPWSDDEPTRLAAAHATPGGTLDLEIVVPDGAEPRAYLRDLRRRIELASLVPHHVIALPAPYLASHQPDGDWPDGPTPDALVTLARDVFPDTAIGAGMLTFFTELNRCPPASGVAGIDDGNPKAGSRSTGGSSVGNPGIGDYVTHGTAAIVHAADTLPVFETLEASPDVFASTRRIARDRPCRLGLVTIGMRSNPYGKGLTTPVGDGTFTTMTDRDARHIGDAGAAFAVAATLLAARAGIRALCLAAPAGPFGLRDSDASPTPLARALASLRALSGSPAAIVGRAPGVLEVRGAGGALRVNASTEPAAGLAPFAIGHGASEARTVSKASTAADAHDTTEERTTTGEKR